MTRNEKLASEIEALRKLREAGLDAWDDVDDPEALIAELRGRKGRKILSSPVDPDEVLDWDMEIEPPPRKIPCGRQPTRRETLLHLAGKAAAMAEQLEVLAGEEPKKGEK